MIYFDSFLRETKRESEKEVDRVTKQNVREKEKEVECIESIQIWCMFSNPTNPSSESLNSFIVILP